MASANRRDLVAADLRRMEGQTWSNFAGCSGEAKDKERAKEVAVRRVPNETMKLKKEDMFLFGVCPAWDQFYLVVCEYCGQVVKPQALIRHMELRHSSNIIHNHFDNSVNSSNNVSTPTSDVGTINSNVCTPEMLAADSFTSESQCTTMSTAALGTKETESHVVCVNASGKAVASPEETATSPVRPATTGIVLPIYQLPSSVTPSSGKSSPVASPVSGTTLEQPSIHPVSHTVAKSSGESTATATPVKKKGAAVKPKFLPCKDREYDPDKHCGVFLSEMKKPCTRSLTCKTHSLTLRRAVQRKTKSFDQLLSEHREAKEAALRAQGIEPKPTKQQLKLEARKQQQVKRQQQQHELLLKQPANDQPRSHLHHASTSMPFNGTLNCQSLLMQQKRTVDAGTGYKAAAFPRPVAICTFGARYLDANQSTCRVFNQRFMLTYSCIKKAMFEAKKRSVAANADESPNEVTVSETNSNSNGTIELTSPSSSSSSSPSLTSLLATSHRQHNHHHPRVKKLKVSSTSTSPLNVQIDHSVHHHNQVNNDPYNFTDTSNSNLTLMKLTLV